MRLKSFVHANVLACQEANLTGRTIAVVIQEHRNYGNYYEGIAYEIAEEAQKKIIVSYKKGSKLKKRPVGVKAILD